VRSRSAGERDTAGERKLAAITDEVDRLSREREEFPPPSPPISDAGPISGGSVLRPGEVRLGHRHVIFLNELPDARRDALEALCRSLEERICYPRRSTL
jgi:predicted ATPase with chaperone activity